MRQAAPLVYPLFFIALVACANTSDTTSSRSEQDISRSKATLDPVYNAGKCHFKLPLNGGTVRTHNGSSVQSAGYYPPGTSLWSVPFICHGGASQDDIYNQIGAKPESGKWIDLDFDEPFKPKQKFKLIKFSGKNWEGIATAVDQIYYAEPDQRSRFFNFCLIENDGPQVLCGRTQIRGVTQPPSVSKLPKIMAVLKTLVFVDPPNTSPPSPATTNKP